MNDSEIPTTSNGMECTSCDGVGHIHLTHFGFNYPVTCQLCQGDGLMKVCGKCGLNIACKNNGEIYVCKNCYYGRLSKKTSE